MYGNELRTAQFHANIYKLALLARLGRLNEIASPVTKPTYSVTGWLSMAVVVVTIKEDLFLFQARLLWRGLQPGSGQLLAAL